MPLSSPSYVLHAPLHLIVLDLICRVIFGGEYRYHQDMLLQICLNGLGKTRKSLASMADLCIGVIKQCNSRVSDMLSYIK